MFPEDAATERECRGGRLPHPQPHGCNGLVDRLRQGHLTEASALQRQLPGTGLSAEQVVSIAEYNRMPVMVALELLTAAKPASAAIDTVPTDAAAIGQIRTAATAYAARRAGGASIRLAPQGVTSLPLPRPVGFDIVQVPRDKLVLSLRRAETNSNPVSGPADARPADRLFGTWFKTFDALGTRTLTMSEMQSLVRLNVEWEAAPNGVRMLGSLPPIKVSKRGLLMPHELHLFASGFRAQVGHNGLAAGQGGEFGLVARATLPASRLGRGWGDEAKIRDFWGAQVRAAPAQSPKSQWVGAEQQLLIASRAEVVKKIEGYVSQGFFADPRDQRALRGITDALLSSQPGSVIREQSAKALIAHFEAAEKRLETVSVSGATAEIQMLQTLSRYLSDNKLSVQNPLDALDVVEVYQLYRRLLATGELTSRATVEGWLRTWGVPSAP